VRALVLWADDPILPSKEAAVATAIDMATPAERPGGDPYRLNASDYYQMIDSGIIPPGRRVYLWDGRLFEKMAKKQPHAIAHSKLARVLFREVPSDRWYVSTENPVEVAGDKVPLPDLAVVRGDPDRYPTRPPAAADVALIAEIMDTSASKDLGANLLAYARAKIPVYWVINIRSRRIEVYSDPVGEGEIPEGYSKSEQFGPGESVVLRLDGCEPIVIPVDQVLPAEVV
jgi:Uma2 family endonuclease